MALFSPKTLTETVNDVEAEVPKIVLDKAFKKKETHPTEILELEFVDGTATVAPLVGTLDGGKVIKGTQKTVQTLVAPRYRPKMHFNPKQLLLNEGAARDLNAAELRKRQLQFVKDEYQNGKNTITRAREKMACELISSGAINVVDDYAEIHIDFEVPADQKPILTGTEKFNDPACPMLTIFKRYQMKAAKCGIKKIMAFGGQETIDLILQNDDVKKDMDRNNVKAGAVTFEDAEYIGTIAGVETYLVDEQYEDKTGTEFDMFPTNVLSFVADGAMKEMFGRVMDIAAPPLTQFFAKSEDAFDPSGETHIQESRPLPTLRKRKGLVIVTTH